MTLAPNTQTGTVHFVTDSHLLVELGERLVATPAVAIAELVKNAYDADATVCHVWRAAGRPKTKDSPAIPDTINLVDDGHGITRDEFMRNWMTIATPAKTLDRFSRKYKRRVTGAKGVGRFAARFLGTSLQLESTSFDKKEGKYCRLTATFNWPGFAEGEDLTKFDVPYKYEIGVPEGATGVTLRITGLRQDWASDLEKKARREVLSICSPLPLLDSGNLRRKGTKSDPGFDVFFAPPEAGTEATVDTVAKEVLSRAFGKVQIKVAGRKVTYSFSFADWADWEDGEAISSTIPENLVGELRGDIRFFPAIKGQFTDFPNITGDVAREWVREQSGIKVLDNGFRVTPYGEPDDDWLKLSLSVAKRERKWRSDLGKEMFGDQPTEGAESPYLKLPANYQLVGAVFIQTSQDQKDSQGRDDTRRLQIAMDRAGYLANEGFGQLQDIVRAAIEALAVRYNEYTLEVKERKVKQERVKMQAEFKEARTAIQTAPSLSQKEKQRLVSNLDAIQRQYFEVDESHRKARESIELLALLGGLAGFMTHETDQLFESVDELLETLKKNEQRLKTMGLQSAVKSAQTARDQLRDQLEYARTFITGLAVTKPITFPARPQVKRVIEKMRITTWTRGVTTENEVPLDLQVGPTLPTVYSGVIMNLYTNAIKAVIDPRNTSGEKRILFTARNDESWHTIMIADTGVGIPIPLRSRIFDPLFTTTSESPLGSGMGLGLTIVKRLMADLGGKVEIVDPPKGFNTAFEVRFRRK